MTKEHHYRLTIEWTGNTGSGTSDYRSYERSHIIKADNKPEIMASSDPAFRGDKTKYNPEELLLASISSCHMLWFLHLCADEDIVVMEYTDNPTGTMIETDNGGGKFSEVILKPEVTVKDSASLNKLENIHHKAHERCFIANSVNFPIIHQATGKVC
jgi:organic hydroperoxide reductase OsmC/OhrA